MSTVSFSEYALSPELTPDATYTVELLIEKARAEFDPNFWDEWTERKNARESRRYKPRFSKDHVPLAEKKLKTLSWLSLQRIRGEERPIRDLNALRFLPKLTGLSLGNNQIRDISPLANCTKLKRLHLELNPITDISALANCKEIEILDLRSTSVENLQVLERLPKLRDLSISAAQIPALRQLARLPALVELGFELDAFDSFEGFPEMPELRIIRDAHVKRLDGLARFSSLENLLNLSGAFVDLPRQDRHHEKICENRSESHPARLMNLGNLPFPFHRHREVMSNAAWFPALVASTRHPYSTRRFRAIM